MRDKKFDVDLLKTLNDQPMPETPLTDDELKLLDGWSAKPEAAWRLRPVASNTECRLRYAPFRPIATTIDEKRRKDQLSVFSNSSASVRPFRHSCRSSADTPSRN